MGNQVMATETEPAEEVPETEPAEAELEEARALLPANTNWISGMCEILPAGNQGQLAKYCSALELLEKEETEEEA